MTNTIIELRHSYVSGNVPTSLANGELAINTYDGKLFYRGGASNTIQSIERYEGPAGLDGEVQFNDSGVLGSSSNLSFNKTTNVLSTKNIIVSGNSYFGNANLHEGITQLSVTNNGGSAYLFDQYTGGNPSLYIGAGQTISFNLNVVGHPFVIRESSGGANTSDGLTHISNTGVVTTGADAQGKVSGVLFWKVPFSLVGNTYVYQCTIHGGMVGNIVIQQPASFVAANTTLAFNTANAAFLAANAAFLAANAATATDTTQNISIAAAFIHANAAFDSANSGGGGGGTITLSPTPPSGNSEGDIWIDSDDGTHYTWVNDNTSYQWIEFSSASDGYVDLTGNITIGSSGSDNITLNSTITGNLLPTANVTYDLGSITQRWRDLYLSGSTLNLGGATIKTDGTTGAIALIPAPSVDNPDPKALVISPTGTITTANTDGGTIDAANIANAATNTEGALSNDFAQAAFDTANSAGSYANSAFEAANNATDTYVRAHANSAFDHANAAFEVANTSSGSGSGSGNVIVFGRSTNTYIPIVTGNITIVGRSTNTNISVN